MIQTLVGPTWNVRTLHATRRYTNQHELDMQAYRLDIRGVATPLERCMQREDPQTNTSQTCKPTYWTSEEWQHLQNVVCNEKIHKPTQVRHVGLQIGHQRIGNTFRTLYATRRQTNQHELDMQAYRLDIRGVATPLERCMQREYRQTNTSQTCRPTDWTSEEWQHLQNVVCNEKIHTKKRVRHVSLHIGHQRSGNTFRTLYATRRQTNQHELDMQAYILDIRGLATPLERCMQREDRQTNTSQTCRPTDWTSEEWQHLQNVACNEKIDKPTRVRHVGLQIGHQRSGNTFRTLYATRRQTNQHELDMQAYGLDIRGVTTPLERCMQREDRQTNTSQTCRPTDWTSEEWQHLQNVVCNEKIHKPTRVRHVGLQIGHQRSGNTFRTLYATRRSTNQHELDIQAYRLDIRGVATPLERCMQREDPQTNTSQTCKPTYWTSEEWQHLQNVVCNEKIHKPTQVRHVGLQIGHQMIGNTFRTLHATRRQTNQHELDMQAYILDIRGVATPLERCMQR